MYNALTRLQSVFGFFTTVAFTLGCFIFATDLYSARTPSTSLLKPTNVQVVRGRPHYHSTRKEEYAVIKFSLDADISSLFTWNTKQVFVYVTAEWNETTKGVSSGENGAVIWDTIITNPSADHLMNLGPHSMKKLKASAKGKSIAPERGLLKLKNQKPKYQIGHPSGKIADVEDVVLKLHYNVQPWFGVLTWNQDESYGFWKAMEGGHSEQFTLPPVKKKDEKKRA